MASGKRQPSKQKRTQQNRQQRSALEARKAAATTPATSSTPSRGSSGGLLGRLRGAAAPRSTSPSTATTSPSTAPPRTASPRAAMAAANRADQPVGYRAALTGLIAAVAAVGVSFILSTPVTQDGDPYTRERVVAEWADTALRAAQSTGATQPDAVVDEIGEDWMPDRDSDRLALAAFPASLAMVLPVVAAWFAFRAVQQRRGSRIVNRAMYATLFGAVLTFGLLTFFLPTVIAVGVAGFQVRKAETAAAMAEASAAGDDEDDEIIEAEVVDEDTAADDDER